MAALLRFFAEQSDQRSIRRTECRCLSLRGGKASGGVWLTAERKRGDTVVADGGVGVSESVAVKDSL